MSRPPLRLVAVSDPFKDRENKPQRKENKIIVLSVEGKTEHSYFNCLNTKLKALGINALVEIEVLEHCKTESFSAPAHVLALMKEYLALRHSGILVPPESMAALEEKFGPEALEKYMEAPHTLDAELAEDMDAEFESLNIDLAYRKFLATHTNPEDHFGIVVDRDWLSNRREKLEEIMRYCESQKIGFYISNPCFDFWLLLHLCDVKMEYANQEEKLLKNRKALGKASFLENEISRRAHHKKEIRPQKFAEAYFPQINRAIARAGCFERNPAKILDALGTNIPDLFNVIDSGNRVFSSAESFDKSLLPKDSGGGQA